MSRARAEVARILALGVALALALLLLAAREASAAPPPSLTLAGGDGWHRANGFDLYWTDPGPVTGVYWRIVGAGGYDSGVQLAPGNGISTLEGLEVPRAGTYLFYLWLRDAAGNRDGESMAELPLRLDDVAPAVAFEPGQGSAAAGWPEEVSAEASDAESGVAAGTISYEPLGGGGWIELPTRIQGGGSAGAARLTAAVPEVEPGTYAFRASAADVAGNVSATTLDAAGAEMTLSKPAPEAAPAHSGHRGRRRAAGPRAGARLVARLRWRRRAGARVTVPFGARAALSGRLLDTAGRGIGGRRLRVVSRPARGAPARARTATVRTGRHGGFRLTLPPGPSRRISVAYAGGRGRGRARRGGLALRVRAGATLSASPRSLFTGESVRLTGRVRTRGARLSRRGKLVAIQYYERGDDHWRPALIVRSDARGRFHARYRFRYVVALARIRLRAAVVPEQRWPYAPGASRPVTVKVSGIFD